MRIKKNIHKRLNYKKEKFYSNYLFNLKYKKI